MKNVLTDISDARDALLIAAKETGFYNTCHIRQSKTRNIFVTSWRRWCRSKERPAIYIEPQVASKRQYCKVTVDLITASFRTNRLLPQITECALDRFGGQKLIRKRCHADRTFLSTSDQLIYVYWLTEMEAISFCQNFLEEMAYVSDREQDYLQTQERNRRRNTYMVKMFKDGKALALQTDATDERKFTADFANALQDFITNPKFEGQYEIEAYLAGYAEICCKMRGYKADVREQRVLTFGEINPNTESLVSVADNGQAQPLDTTA